MVGEWVRATAAHSLRDKNNRITFRKKITVISKARLTLAT